MKRLFLALALLICCALPALATQITVTSFSIPNYRWGSTTAKIRLYSNMTWTSSTGVTHLAGTAGSTTGFFQEISCTVSGTTLFVPSFVIDSTVDALQNKTVLLTATIFDSNNRAHEQLFANWRIPKQPTPTTWVDLVVYNAGQPKPLGDTYATLAQVNAMIVSAINASSAAASSRFANGETSNACSPGDVFFRQADGHYYGCPVSNNPSQFLLANEPLSGANIQDPGAAGTSVECSGVDDTTALTDAIARADGGFIVIQKGQTCKTGTITIPALRIAKGGILWPLDSQTVTLSGQFEAGIYQAFDNANAGEGTVTLSSTEIDTVYPQWWGAFPSNSAADNNAPVQAFFKGLGVGRVNGTGAKNRTGKITGNFHVSTEIVLDDWIGFTLIGDNKFYSGFTQEATNTRLLAADHIAYGVFFNLSFSAAASQNTTLIEIDSSNASTDLSPQAIHFSNTVFSGNGVGYTGLRIASSGGGAQGDDITIEDSKFTGFSQAAIQIGGGADGTPTALAFNAIYIRIKHNDIQSCPKYGIAVYGGSILADGTNQENQTLNNVGFPTQTGSDYLIWGPQNVSDIRNARSESLRFIQANGPTDISNITMAPYGAPWWSGGGSTLSGTIAYPDELVTGTITGGDGKLYKVTAAPAGATEGAHAITTPFSTSVITDSTGAYVVNAWVGHWMRVIYPNCFTVYGVVASNTATTFTLVSPIPFTPGDVSPDQTCGGHTTYNLFTASGDPFPRWSGLPITTATGGSLTTIVKTGAGWGVNAFVGFRASVVSGAGKYQYGVISANTADTITVPAWSTDYELEVLPAYGIAAPTAGSTFVVEPNWGTQTSDGVIQWTLFDYKVLDGIDGSSFAGNVDGFRGSQGGVYFVNPGGGTYQNIVPTRIDWLGGNAAPLGFDNVFTRSPFHNIIINRVVNSGDDYGIPWTVHRNSGQEVLGPGITWRTQGTEPICWQAGETGGGVNYTDLCIGRGDDQFGNTTTNKDILAFTGKWGRRTARGTNQAGTNTDIAGGLNTGSGAPGGIRLYLGSVGSTGATPGTLSVVAGVSPTRMWYSNKGADVASASTITPTGNLFHVTGTTEITSVSGTGVIAGTSITMVFDGAAQVTNGSNLKLRGNFYSAANDSLSVYYDGTNWIEQARSNRGGNVSLTDNGSTIATNAALGSTFRVTALTANVTLSNPTNSVNGQTITWEIIQHASAAKTLAFDTKFGFGAEITGCTISATTSSHNFITAVYNSTTDKWYVRGCVTGY